MRKQTDHEFQYRFGKMIRGMHPLLLEDNQLSDAQNMQPGFGWKQRRGMATLTATPVASGLRFKKIYQYRDLKGNTDVILAHTYDGSGGEDIYQGSALPPSAVTWAKKYDLSANCTRTQFDTVAGALIAANNKDFLIWRGTTHFPTGVWKYIDSTDSFIDYYEWMTDGKAATVMDLDAFNNQADMIYYTSEMPLDTITPTIAAYNLLPANMILRKWNGAWTALTIDDGTSQDPASGLMTDHLDDNNLDTDIWTEHIGVSGGDVNEQNNVLEILSAADPVNADTADPTGVYQVATGDFECTVYLAAPAINANYERAGFLAWTDTDNWMHCVKTYSSGQKVSRADTVSGSYTSNPVSYAPTSLYLKMTRVGEDFKCYRSADAITWTEFTNGGPNFKTTDPVWVWLYATTAGGSQYTASFSNFEAKGKSLSQQGDVTWTAATDELPTVIDGTPGFAYQMSWDEDLSGNVEVSSVDVHAPMAEVRDVWDGMPMGATGCYVYDGTDHTDYVAYVNNMVESQAADLSSATTSYKFYVGFPRRTTRIKVWVAVGGKNTDAAEIDTIKYHKYDGTWVTVGDVVDTTLVATETLSQKGYWEWADPGEENEFATIVGGDDTPMYWYEVVFDATLDAEVYIYFLQGIPAGDDPDESYGCFAWKRRAWQISPRNAENAVRYSADNLPNVWHGPDSGYIYFGERPLLAAAPYYNETLLFADTELWMLQGNDPASWGRLRLSSQIGIVAPDSVISIETGALVGESLKILVAWFFYDGIWMFDGVRIWKISAPDVDSFFDPEHDDYINPAYIDQTSGVFDFETQCAVWTVYSGSGQTTPNKSIVMHFPTLNFSVYDYGTDLGAMCNIINNRYYLTAGGHADGRFFQLNSDTTDRDSSNSEVAVDAYLTTRDMFLSFSEGLQQRLLSVWAEQQSGGEIEVDVYPDGSDTPQNITKQSMTVLGKIYTTLQKKLRKWSGQETTKFRIRNRSKNARMNLLGFSATVDRGRTEKE